MLRKFSYLFLILIGFSVFTAQPAHAAPSGHPRIDALLAALNEPGLKFIRNGETHDGAWAKKHLTDKWNETKGVNNADDFIAKVATNSRETGKPYIIETKDGKQMPAADWFRQRLKEIDAKNKK